jgi:hypothetical protein
MEIDIVLTGKGGELDRKRVVLEDGEDSIGSMEFQEVIAGWTLCPGDTITIVEVL